MSTPRQAAELCGTGPRSELGWVLLPAVVMSLGWGLRGYIGGGPFGAMIPGSLVSLLLCQFLGYGPTASAVVVVFGTFGIGFGGNMTYGQTLGLIRDSESFWWGLAGTTLKGSVWGLLGGGMLGLGFVARHLPRRHVIVALVCLMLGTCLGIYWINQPKLIYFSDPVNKPRDESWAGFLIGALALLGYLRWAQPALANIAWRFAGFGLIGGGLGFGGGSLFLAAQPLLSESWNWMPFWKYMEFTFGFLFGGGLGWCAWRARESLQALVTPPAGQAVEATRDGCSRGVWIGDFLIAVAVVSAVFYGWSLFVGLLIPILRQMPRGSGLRTAAQVLFGFMGMGCAFMLLSTWLRIAAWQCAISVTIIAAAIDWQRDLLPRGNIHLAEIYRTAFVLVVAAASILFVHAWQHGKQRLMDLFLFAVCMLMSIGYLMGLGMADIWQPDLEAVAQAGGRASYLWQTYRAEIIVHCIFTTLFLVSLVVALKERSSAPAASVEP